MRKRPVILIGVFLLLAGLVIFGEVNRRTPSLPSPPEVISRPENRKEAGSGTSPGENRTVPENPRRGVPVVAVAETIVAPRLSLRGIIFGEGLSSRAMIKNLESGEEKFYQTGDEIAPFVIAEIKEDRVLLRRDDKEFVLRLSGIETEGTSSLTGPTEVRAVGDKYITKWHNLKIKTPQEVSAEVGAYLGELAKLRPEVYDRKEGLNFPDTQQVSENTWEVGRKDAEKAVRNAGRIFNQAELTPQFSGENLEGFRVNFRTGQGSVWEEMGFQNNDIITKVNEININGIGRMIAAARSAQASGRAQVKLIRQGQMITQTYEVKE